MDRTILANEKNADLFISIHYKPMPKEKAEQVVLRHFSKSCKNEVNKKSCCFRK